MTLAIVIAVVCAGGFYYAATVAKWDRLARWTVAWVAFAICMFDFELSELHRHVHAVECAVTGSISDRDGSVWKEDCEDG